MYSGINRNVLACLALPCLAPGYLPNPTLARYLRGKIEIKKTEKLG